MTRQELEDKLASLGFEETDEVNDLHSYLIETPEDTDWSDVDPAERPLILYDTYYVYAKDYHITYEIRVYIGDDNNYPPETVYSVRICNYPDDFYRGLYDTGYWSV